MARNYSGKVVEEQSFASWHEYINHVTTAEYEPGSSRSLGNNSWDSWNGTRTWKEAVDLARKGWPSLGLKVKEISDDLFVKLSRYCLRPEPRYVTEGYTLDIGRWIEGEPEHWLIMDESETTLQGKRVCRIVYNQTASAGISVQRMQAKGATVAALIRLLDYCDIRTELELIGVISEGYRRGGEDNTDDRIIYRVAVKNAAQNLDFDITSFAIGHPASFRRIGFACMETFSPEIREKFSIRTRGRYGYPGDLNQTEIAACDVYVGSQMLGEPEWESNESTQKWVLDQLVAQGVQLKERD